MMSRLERRKDKDCATFDKYRSSWLFLGLIVGIARACVFCFLNLRSQTAAVVGGLVGGRACIGEKGEPRAPFIVYLLLLCTYL